MVETTVLSMLDPSASALRCAMAAKRLVTGCRLTMIKTLRSIVFSTDTRQAGRAWRSPAPLLRA